jgi:hypothetical protein
VRTAALAVLVALAVAALPQAAGAAPVNVTCNGGACSTGWYRTPVAVVFQWDATGAARTSGCDRQTVSDVVGKQITCTVSYNNGSIASLSVTINSDTMPPTITSAGPARGPDANGWYNHPVAVVFSGSDATSGVASCTSITYRGPDTGGTTIGGTCTDQAGNTSAPQSVSLRYDSTPPTLTKVGVVAGDHFAKLSWSASPDTMLIEIVRSPGTSGPVPATVFSGQGSHYEDKTVTNHVKYVYKISAFDQAGNEAVQTISVLPAASLYSPAKGAGVETPPLLAWEPFAKASYYNVQVFRGNRKILSTWPSHPHIRLSAKWMFGNEHIRLRPGAYRWYVWPGFGKRTSHKYGPLLGQSDFVVLR